MQKQVPTQLIERDGEILDQAICPACGKVALGYLPEDGGFITAVEGTGCEHFRGFYNGGDCTVAHFEWPNRRSS